MPPLPNKQPAISAFDKRPELFRNMQNNILLNEKYLKKKYPSSLS